MSKSRKKVDLNRLKEMFDADGDIVIDDDLEAGEGEFSKRILVLRTGVVGESDYTVEVQIGTIYEEDGDEQCEGIEAFDSTLEGFGLMVECFVSHGGGVYLFPSIQHS